MIFIICMMCTLIAGCGRDNKFELFVDNISEARYNYYFGEADGYIVSFTSGIREIDYKLDGYHTDNVEFGVITIELPEDVECTDATFRLQYGSKVDSGVLEVNPFDNTLMADVGYIIDDVDIKITITMNDIIKVISLRDVTDSFQYDYLSALQIFVDENSEDLEKFVDGGLLAEVYIKIMHDDTIDSGYYYLIRVIGRSGYMLSGIINPMTGDILAVTSSLL